MKNHKASRGIAATRDKSRDVTFLENDYTQFAWPKLSFNMELYVDTTVSCLLHFDHCLSNHCSLFITDMGTWLF